MKRILVRVSLGSLAVLGLDDVRIDVFPTTIYLLQYSPSGCLGGCRFCPQSVVNKGASKSFVSRVSWPLVDLNSVADRLEKHNSYVKRVCVQSILKPYWREELLYIIDNLRRSSNVPISAAVNLVDRNFLSRLYDLDVDFVGIGLDAASRDVFVEIGKPGTWHAYMRFIKNAIQIFGNRSVIVHLIVGLGEKEYELYRLMEELYGMGASVALFAYTPSPGVSISLRSPSVYKYRRAQLVMFFLSKGYSLQEIISSTDRRIVFRKWVVDMVSKRPWEVLDAFLTSGCPGCNRPFYNESPRGPIYNFPNREMLDKWRSILVNEIIEAVKNW